MNDAQASESQVIAGTFHVLRRFCRNVALLLETTENLFDDEPKWRSALSYKMCVGGNDSESMDNPMQWLPTRFFRCYCPKSEPQHLAYVSILFELPDGQEMTGGQTLLTAGILTHESADGWAKFQKGHSRYFKWHLLRDDRMDSGRLALHEPPFRWNTAALPKNWAKDCQKIKRATTLAMPIDHIANSETLKKEVVAPLMLAVEGVH